MKKSFDKKAIKAQDIESEGTLQSLLWEPSASHLVLGSGPAPEEYDDLEAEQELDFGGY